MNSSTNEGGNATNSNPSSAASQGQPWEWFHVTLANIRDAVITTDSSGIVTFLNPVAQELTGWTQQEAAGKSLDTIFNIVNEATRLALENPVERALREGVAVALANQTLLIAKDGTEHPIGPIGESAAPIRDAFGEATGAVLVFRDVTERRRHERQIQDALAFSDDIIATLREPFLILDKQMTVISANRAFYETFQVTPNETLGRFVYDLGNHQWDTPPLRLRLEEVLPQDHTLNDFELELDLANVGRKVMLLNARRVRRPNDDSELIMLAISDITHYKQDGMALRNSELRYRRLFEAAHDGILILGAATRKITHVNPFLTNLLDYPAEHFLGKELWEIGFLRDKEASQAAMQLLEEQGSIRYECLPLEDRWGLTHPVEMVANLYQEDRHSVIQCNIRDISERNHLETLQRKQAAEVSDLHRRKDEFLAMLSHELRSPLAPIANAVQLLGLQREHESRTQQQARGIIERQLAQLQHLVDDLLEVSRITSGKIQLRQVRATASRIVDGALETVRPLLEQRRHELKVTLPPEPLWLYVDVSRIEQVLVNLLTNAVKFTDEGGHIELSVQQQADACIVRVHDSGVGISPVLLPRIFDLFTQGERSLDRAQGGLGIGLALAQRLTELHGGKIEVFSTVGKGSEFVVRLPIWKPEVERPFDSTDKPPNPRPAPLKVLVVDDNADTVLSFSMLLRAAGHEVRTANDGVIALQVARDFQPRVVMLDIGLPGLNGYEVAKLIRQDSRHSKVVLIAVTGYGQESDKQVSLQAGFDHHLVKPARLAQLQEILSEVDRA